MGDDKWEGLDSGGGNSVGYGGDFFFVGGFSLSLSHSLSVAITGYLLSELGTFSKISRSKNIAQ